MYSKFCSNKMTIIYTGCDNSDFCIQPNDSDTNHIIPRHKNLDNCTTCLGFTLFRHGNQATSTSERCIDSHALTAMGFNRSWSMEMMMAYI